MLGGARCVWKPRFRNKGDASIPQRFGPSSGVAASKRGDEQSEPSQGGLHQISTTDAGLLHTGSLS